MTVYRSFEMMLQPNAWSCLPTALAMVLSRTPKEIIDALGHDGSKIIFPEKSEPENRQSFHLQEIIDIAVANWETPILVEANPGEDDWTLFSESEAKSRFNYYLFSAPGILLGFGEKGLPHAVAWDGELVWDPRGQKYQVDKFNPLGMLVFL